MWIRTMSTVLACAVAAGCDGVQPEPTAVADVAFVRAPAEARNATAAPISGDQEAPEPVETKARGAAKFQLAADGQSISYRLNVANIENVLMAHIHIGVVGEPGPVVVWLYPEGPPPQLIPGRFQGTLMTGTFTEEDLVGPLENASLADLWEAIRAGATYVNVHTTAHPSGEIRGQIDAAGHID